MSEKIHLTEIYKKKLHNPRKVREQLLQTQAVSESENKLSEEV
jgi:hypothetical protein